MSDDRARLTFIDVIYYGVALGIFLLLVGPIYTLLNANASQLGTGDAYLLRMIVPAVIITIYVVIFRTSIGGAS